MACMLAINNFVARAPAINRFVAFEQAINEFVALVQAIKNFMAYVPAINCSYVVSVDFVLQFRLMVCRDASPSVRLNELWTNIEKKLQGIRRNSRRYCPSCWNSKNTGNMPSCVKGNWNVCYLPSMMLGRWAAKYIKTNRSQSNRSSANPSTLAPTRT